MARDAFRHQKLVLPTPIRMYPLSHPQPYPDCQRQLIFSAVRYFIPVLHFPFFPLLPVCTNNVEKSEP